MHSNLYLLEAPLFAVPLVNNYETSLSTVYYQLDNMLRLLNSMIHADPLPR